MFITFEGIDGSGKTTQIRLLHQQYPSAYFTHEPGGEHARLQQMRQIFFEPGWSPLEELMIVIAMRSYHWRHEMEPQLKKGSWIFCDRFIHSTYAYQGIVEGVDRTTINTMHAMAFGGMNHIPKPDRTYVLDMDPMLAMDRLQNKSKNHFDNNGIDFYKKLRQAYVQLSQEDSSICMVDASQHPKKIHEYIIQDLQHISRG